MLTINGQNYFNEKSFNEICEALEKAESIEIYIDVVGHSRNNYEQENYKDALTKKYGDRLQVKCNEGAYSYSYFYHLKQPVSK